MQSLPAGVGQEGIAQREHTCRRTPRVLHPHFEAPRSPLDATAAQAAQAETSQRTQTARREDKPTNHQTTALISMRHLRHSPPVQRQASRPALLLTAPPAPKQWWNSRQPVQSVVEPLHPTPIRRTRDCSSGAAAEQKWTCTGGSDVELTLPLVARPGWASINSCLSSLLIAVLHRCTALFVCLFIICTAYLHFNVYDKVVQQYSTGRSLFGSFVGMKV